jgi:acyl-coenzyme A synthetase/AMP-(fatty) acid ligase
MAATESVAMTFRSACLAEQVAPYKKIRRWEIVTQVPNTAWGKILRRGLVGQERARVASGTGGQHVPVS